MRFILSSLFLLGIVFLSFQIDNSYRAQSTLVSELLLGSCIGLGIGLWLYHLLALSVLESVLGGFFGVVFGSLSFHVCMGIGIRYLADEPYTYQATIVEWSSSKYCTDWAHVYDAKLERNVQFCVPGAKRQGAQAIAVRGKTGTLGSYLSFYRPVS